jgi:hypothetical protein
MSPAEFLRLYHLRAPHLMWMLGLVPRQHRGAAQQETWVAEGPRTSSKKLQDYPRLIGKATCSLS